MCIISTSFNELDKTMMIFKAMVSVEANGKTRTFFTWDDAIAYACETFGMDIADTTAKSLLGQELFPYGLDENRYALFCKIFAESF